MGGGGNDTILGGAAGDILDGDRGSDTIRGQAGNDAIDGGPQVDDCTQGAGRGPVRRCERADLAVRVIGPASPAPEGTVRFKVRIRNRGPNATTGTVVVDEDNRHASCDAPWEGQLDSIARLRKGQVVTLIRDIECVIEDPDPWVQVRAQVRADARDPRSGNDKDKSRRITLQ